MVFIFLLGIACTSATRDAQPPDGITAPRTNQSRPRIAVTKGGEIRGGCRVRQVARLVVKFVQAINEGNWHRTARFFPPAATTLTEQSESFQRYAVDDGFVGEDPVEVLRYLEERHRQKERLGLVSIDVKASSYPLSSPGFADIVFVAERSALDLESPNGGIPYFGKAQVNCDHRTVHVWAMGRQGNALEIAAHMCPRSPSHTLPAAVVACRAR